MTIGEGAGKVEDQQGKAFVGPAGEKGDIIFSFIGLDPNLDIYWSNVSHCRPIAPVGTHKENVPPTDDQVATCLPYLLHQINIVKPKVIITLGMIAFKGLFPVQTKQTGAVLLNIVNKPFWSERFNAIVLPMYHPAVLLYSQRFEDQYKFYRFAIRDQALTLKAIIYNNYKITKEK
jgi:uracil-DNA glycosylase